MTCIFHTPTPNLEQSREFYSRLGFKAIEAEGKTVFTDGKAVLEINEERTARAGIRIYKDSWQAEIEQLSAQTAVTKTKDGSFLLGDGSGTWIYLTEGVPGFDLTPSASSFSVLGNFAGLTIETTDFARSASIYEALGFAIVSGGPDKGWAAFSNGDFGLSMMPPLSCPHLFFNPSISYFNGGKNLPVIEKLRSLSIPITEEITLFNKDGVVDNVIIRDPGGYGFFVFND